MTDYVLEVPARFLQCGAEITEKTCPWRTPEGDTAVVSTHRHFKGQFFTVVERIRIDEDRRLLVYEHEVTGNNKSDEREIAFDLMP